MAPKKATVAWNIAAVLGALLLIASVVPSKTGPHLPSARPKAVNQLKQLSLGCRAYAADWEGKYPPTLEALYPDYMEVEDLFCTTDQNER